MKSRRDLCVVTFVILKVIRLCKKEVNELQNMLLETF